MDGLNSDGGGSESGDVDGVRWESVIVTSPQERRALRKRLKRELEELDSLRLQIDAREEQLKNVPDRSVRASHSYAHRSGSDNGSSGGKEVTLETPATLTQARRLVNSRETKLARQRSVIVSTGRLPVQTPGIAIAGHGKEKRTLKPTQLYRLDPQFVSGKDKIPPREKVKPEARVGTKRGAPGKAGSARLAERSKLESARTMPMADIIKLHCNTILNNLRSDPDAWFFDKPVDAVDLGILDYHTVIQEPMDLGTVQGKLACGNYTTPDEFAREIRLTFLNAMKYNPAHHDVFLVAERLLASFEDMYKNMVNEDAIVAAKILLGMSLLASFEDMYKNMVNEDAIVAAKILLGMSRGER